MEIRYPKLDIADNKSVKAFVDSVKQEEGGVDVLINNAGVNLDDQYSLDNVQQTLRTNVYGTLDVRLPLIGYSLWLISRADISTIRCAKASCL